MAGKYSEAFNVLEAEARKSNPRAIYLMARYYLDCYNVVKRDESKCGDLLVIADLKLNDPLCNYQLYLLFPVLKEKDELIKEKSLEIISQMAKNGDILAMHNLGLMYQNGDGVSKNYYEAFKWYKKAAENGFVPSQCNLGLLSDCAANDENWEDTGYEGILTDAEYDNELCDDSKSVSWLKMAAEAGIPRAQYYLGLKYEEYEIVVDDLLIDNDEEAKKWYKKAADQGYEKAISKLDLLSIPAAVPLAVEDAEDDVNPSINDAEAVSWDDVKSSFRDVLDSGRDLADAVADRTSEIKDSIANFFGGLF